MGEVQEIGNTFVITKRGLVSKDEFYLPKYLVEGYDGHVVRFNITKEKQKQIQYRSWSTWIYGRVQQEKNQSRHES